MSRMKNVLITGASSGIGEACALELAKRGWRVFAGVRRLRDFPEGITPVVLDVTNAEHVAQTAALLQKECGSAGLQGLVNNAGMSLGGPLEFVPLEEFRKLFEVNVTGQLRVIQALLELLRLGTGRIVNMSSLSGRITAPYLGPYSASKFALEAMSDALRLELKPWNIRVVLIEPGQIDTPIWHKSLAESDRLEKDLPSRAVELYGQGLAQIREIVHSASRDSSPASTVANAVAHALTTRWPWPRYPVGRYSWLKYVFHLLPPRVSDWLLLTQFPRK